MPIDIIFAFAVFTVSALAALARIAYKDGYRAGKHAGWADGFSDGQQTGYEQGVMVGEIDAQNRSEKETKHG